MPWKAFPRTACATHVLLGELAGPPHHRRAAARHRRPHPAGAHRGLCDRRRQSARHEHEWKVWQDVKLPAGQGGWCPGVISHATNIVEHPELVCERIVRLGAPSPAARTSSPATDCGFAQKPDVPAGASDHHVGEARSARRGGERLAEQGAMGIVRAGHWRSIPGLLHFEFSLWALGPRAAP